LNPQKHGLGPFKISEEVKKVIHNAKFDLSFIRASQKRMAKVWGWDQGLEVPSLQYAFTRNGCRSIEDGDV
jgi:hypothetical protein